MKSALVVTLLLSFASGYAQIIGPASITSSPPPAVVYASRTAFSHTMLAQPNSLLRVDCSENEGAWR